MEGDLFQSLPRLTHLNVANNELEALPDAICSLPLQELQIQGNKLRELPQMLGAVKTLRLLNASNNILESLPMSLARLTYLAQLDVSFNKLKDLDALLRENALANLLELMANNNSLIELCGVDVMAVLPKLTRLDLKHNRLTHVKILLGCPVLKELCLANNKLTHFQCEFEELEVLDLRDNKLVELPPDVLKMSRLKRLDLTNNDIKVLEPKLGLMTDLQFLLFSGNPIRGLPAGPTSKVLHLLKDRIPGK